MHSLVKKIFWEFKSNMPMWFLWLVFLVNLFAAVPAVILGAAGLKHVVSAVIALIYWLTITAEKPSEN